MMRIVLSLVLCSAAVWLIACGEEEVAAPDPTVSKTAEPVPSGWRTYSDTGGLFTLRYPPDWFQNGSSFSSKDLTGVHGFTPEAIEIEVGYYKALGSSSCGAAVSVDPKDGKELGPLAGATSTILGGVSAWRTHRIVAEGDFIEGSEQGLNRVEQISAIFDGYCVVISGYFVQENPDVEIFERIVSGFDFKEKT